MSKDIVVLVTALIMLLTVGYGAAATSAPTSILSGPLMQIDIKDAEIEAVRGTPNGRLKWTYESYTGVHFKLFQDKLDRVELVDDRAIIFHFANHRLEAWGRRGYGRCLCRVRGVGVIRVRARNQGLMG